MILNGGGNVDKMEQIIKMNYSRSGEARYKLKAVMQEADWLQERRLFKVTCQ
jgi:hypothetical protein